jgi:hypothetical protein
MHSIAASSPKPSDVQLSIPELRISPGQEKTRQRVHELASVWYPHERPRTNTCTCARRLLVPPQNLQYILRCIQVLVPQGQRIWCKEEVKSMRSAPFISFPPTIYCLDHHEQEISDGPHHHQHCLRSFSSLVWNLDQGRSGQPTTCRVCILSLVAD